MRRNLTLPALLLGLALVGLIITAGCIGTDNTPATFFSGTGNDSIATELPAGVYILTITQTSAEMTDVTVETKETGTSIQGRYSDAAAESAETAKGWIWSYALQTDGKPTLIINATGDWNADFAVPQQIDGIPPQIFQGTGNAATPFFMINKGNISFAIEATNNTALEVHLMDYNGNPVMDETNSFEQPLAYHLGEYHNTVIVPLTDSDNYLLNIICDGDWSVTVTDKQA
ncbi:MAG TPA: hypothetical protein VJY43_01685 [Methanocorpusculum sp.]|nr:hypothetical protein [Methanocorpusculum sp.]